MEGRDIDIVAIGVPFFPMGGTALAGVELAGAARLAQPGSLLPEPAPF